MREQDVEAAERLAGRSALEERGIQIGRGGVEGEQRRRIDVDRFEESADRSIQCAEDQRAVGAAEAEGV